MKKTFIACLITLAAISCSKDNDPDPGTGGEKYMSLTAGSTWNYEVQDNSGSGTTTPYTLTSTSRDTTIGSKSYHIFTNSNGNTSEYYNINGNEYYTYQMLPDALGGAAVENLYLKTNFALNTPWVQTYNIDYSGLPIPVEITHKITETGLTKTVKGNTYSNVIHVVTSLAVTGPFAGSVSITSNINYYYAPQKGMIENSSQITITLLGGTPTTTDTQTSLVSATIL